MRISRNNIAFTTLRSKLIRGRKTKGKSGSARTSSNSKKRTNASTLAQKSSLTQRTGIQNTSTAKTILENTKTNYTNIKRAAEAESSALNKLLEEGADSLFGYEETQPKKEEIAAQVKAAAEAYNTMMSKLTEEGGRVNDMYARQLRNLFISNKNKLEKAGITQDKYGKMELDKEKLQNAEIQVLKEIFQGTDSFGGKLLERSEKIIDNADTNLNSINNATYSTLLSNYGSSGSRFNSWG